MELFVITMFWFNVTTAVLNGVSYYYERNPQLSIAVIINMFIAFWAASVLGWL